MKIHFNNTYLDIIPTDDSYRYRQIMGDHSLTLYFSLSEHTEIPTGATCEFQGETYILNLPAKIVKQNRFHFDYTLIMDSEGAKLRQLKFKNPNDHSLKFPLTATPEQHLQMLIEVLNSAPTGGVWQMGQCISGTEKLISYNHNSCAEALQMIAQAFETEYEIKGKTIHLQKVEHFKNAPLPLSYGKGNGFKSGVGRVTEQSRITRLFVQGGDRNIDRSKYGSKALLLPKNQEYTHDGTTYISDHQGLSISIKNAPDDGFINEQSLDLSHIYPKRQGTISQVFEVNPDKNFYDFADETIPTDCDFSALQIKGEKMAVYFESGMLSGREFEIQKYKHSQKRFELVPKEEDGVTMPNAIFKPAMGDQYAVFNMQMPDSYICDNTTQTGASWEMMKEACKYFSENQDDIFNFNGELDGIWAKKNWVNVGGKLVLGGYIHFSDTQFQPEPIAIRIVGLKEYVNNPHSPQIELSNKIQSGGFLSEIRKISNQEVKFEDLNRQAVSFTKRRWRDTQETISQIEGAMSHFGKSINPATIQTMMTLIGDKSLQFEFVQSKQIPVRVPHLLYFNKETKQLHVGGGWLKHHTLGINEIKPNRSHEEYRYWLLSPFVSGRLDEADKKYYLYAKVSQSQEVGSFWLSEHSIELEQEAGYYHLLVGTLNSEYQGDRGFARLYGFTEILPGQMKIDKISSGDGQQFIEFLPDRININANVTFTDGSPAFNQLKTAVSPDLLSLENRLKAFSEQKVNDLQIGGRNLVLSSDKFKVGYVSNGIDQSITSQGYLQVTTTAGNGNWHTGWDFNRRTLNPFLNEDDDFIVIFWVKRLSGTGKPTIYLSNRMGYFALLGELNNETFSPIYYTGKWKTSPFVPHLGWSGTNGVFQINKWAIFKGNKLEDWKPAPEDVQAQIQAEQEARQSAINLLQTSVNQTQQSISTLNTYVDGAFKDGIISKTEAIAIEKYINSLGETMAEMGATYNKLNDNAHLSGSTKTHLQEAYNRLITAKNDLQNAINQAIADHQTSPQEKANVDSKFTTFNLRVGEFRNAVQEANVFIQNKIQSDTLESSQTAINEAKQATESYAQAQAELAKTLAIANADDKISEAEQRQIDNATQKLQEAKTYAEQKVNELQVGGRNLLRNSKHVKKGDEGGGIAYVGKITEMIAGQTYIITAKKINGRINEDDFYLNQRKDWWNGTPQSVTIGVPFVAIENHKHLWVRCLYNGTEAEYQFIMLEKGNKPTDWSPAPEDVEQRITDVQSDLQTAINNAKDLINTEKLNVKKVTDRLAGKIDFLNDTKINGNTVATGALLVGNVFGGNAGINGSGFSTTDVRFFAGANFANKGNAPFRVLDDGSMFSTKGKIGGFSIDENSLGTDISDFHQLGTNSRGIHLKEDLFKIWHFGKIYNPSNSFETRINDVYITPFSVVVKETHNSTKGIKITPDGIYRITNNSETKIL